MRHRPGSGRHHGSHDAPRGAAEDAVHADRHHGDRTSYTIAIAGAPKCGGATACFLADISGVRGKRLDASLGVKLPITDKITGRYQKLSCGGSCSPPSLSWMFAGNRYDIQAKVGGKDPKLALAQAARSAIAMGPR